MALHACALGLFEAKIKLVHGLYCTCRMNDCSAQALHSLFTCIVSKQLPNLWNELTGAQEITKLILTSWVSKLAHWVHFPNLETGWKLSVNKPYGTLVHLSLSCCADNFFFYYCRFGSMYFTCPHNWDNKIVDTSSLKEARVGKTFLFRLDLC